MFFDSVLIGLGDLLQSRQQVVQLPHVKLLNQQFQARLAHQGILCINWDAWSWEWLGLSPDFPMAGSCDASSSTHPVHPADSCKPQALNTLYLTWGSDAFCT